MIQAIADTRMVSGYLPPDTRLPIIDQVRDAAEVVPGVGAVEAYITCRWKVRGCRRGSGASSHGAA